jgi:hypothetical protein
MTTPDPTQRCRAEYKPLPFDHNARVVRCNLPPASLVDDPLLSEYERGLAEGRRLQHEADVAALRDEGERRGNPAASLLWTAELLASHGPTDGSSE